jgi:hypothetical protein
VTPCNLKGGQQIFEETFYLRLQDPSEESKNVVDCTGRLQGDRIQSGAVVKLKMESVCAFELRYFTNTTARRHKPEDSSLLLSQIKIVSIK